MNVSLKTPAIENELALTGQFFNRAASAAGWPTLLVFKSGTGVNRIIGFTSKNNLAAKLGAQSN